ncbi:MAG TPA: hypothetical protein VMW62_02005 [Chloroflexota bacterium]|nr:hypothetical protein [Chloroflexota bacterium]
MRTVLAALIALLALAIGILHFALDFVLFGGRFVSSGPPPGGPRRAPAGPPPGGIASIVGPHLPELFVANMVVFVVLAIVFLAFSRSRPPVRTAIDFLIVLVTVVTLACWYGIGRPNPRGLGRWAVTLEFALIAAALVHALIVSRRARIRPATA